MPSAQILLSGSMIATTKDGVVFNNPYKEAEMAKIASLEKHVKMVCFCGMQFACYVTIK